MQLKPEQFLALHPVFSRADLAILLRRRNLKANPSTIESHLYRWMTQGRIRQVKRGVYVHAGDKKKEISYDKFSLGSKLAPDALLSHHSALELHGVAQSAFRGVTYLTLTSVKGFTFDGTSFSPIRPRPALRKSAYQTRWVERTVRQNTDVRYTSIERTLVDVFDRPELAGGIDEVWRSTGAIAGLRFKELEEYLRILGRSTVAARIGFYLERRKDELAVPAGVLSRLEKLGPKSTVYFLRREQKDGRFVPRWNLIVPTELLENDWEGSEDAS